MNHCAKYLGQRSRDISFIYYSNIYRHTDGRPTALYGHKTVCKDGNAGKKLYTNLFVYQLQWCSPIVSVID